VIRFSHSWTSLQFLQVYPTLRMLALHTAVNTALGKKRKRNKGHALKVSCQNTCFWGLQLFILWGSKLFDFPMLTCLMKCNGSRPCNTCIKRGYHCSYGESSEHSEEGPSPKRRMTDQYAGSAFSPINKHPQISLQPLIQYNQSQELPQWTPAGLPEVPVMLQHHDTPIINEPPESMTPFPDSIGNDKKDRLNPVDQASHLFSRGTSVSGQDEEAVIYSNTRMLQDPTGRLCKISCLYKCHSLHKQ